MQSNNFFNTSLNKTVAKEMQLSKKTQLLNKVFKNKLFKKGLLNKFFKGLENREIIKSLLEHRKTVQAKFLYQSQKVMKKTSDE